MKIIIPNLPIAIMHDIIQCLESVKQILHIEPLFWNIEHKPIIDMFDEIKPSIVFIHESQLDKALKEFNKVRIKSGMAMVTIEQYRPLFEKNMEREWFE